MKLIRIKPDLFVVVENELPKFGDYYLAHETKNICKWDIVVNKEALPYCDIIIYSTEEAYGNYGTIDLSEIKALIGEIDVEKKAIDYFKEERKKRSDDFYRNSSKEQKDTLYSIYDKTVAPIYINGYNQCLEDNKEKMYTKEDMKSNIERAICAAFVNKDDKIFDLATQTNRDKYINEVIQSLKPKTEWEVEFDSTGKLKLK